MYLDGVFFFFNDTATTEIYTLSLHDALPICLRCPRSAVSARLIPSQSARRRPASPGRRRRRIRAGSERSEEHTSELQSQSNLVCRLLLEKKNERVDTHSMSPTHRVRPPQRRH